MGGFRDREALTSCADLRFAGDSPAMLIDPSRWELRSSSLTAPTYEDALAARAMKSLRIGGRQAQIKATSGSVVLQIIKLRAIPLSEEFDSAPSSMTP